MLLLAMHVIVCVWVSVRGACMWPCVSCVAALQHSQASSSYLLSSGMHTSCCWDHPCRARKASLLRPPGSSIALKAVP